MVAAIFSLRMQILCLTLFSLSLICTAFTSRDYSDALEKSILFFEGQRSGRLPPNQRLNWRGNSDLSDGASYHVGDPNLDHKCWERPEDMDTPRNVYKVSTQNPGSDLAAETAAALAAASIAFKETDSYSAKLLETVKKVLFACVHGSFAAHTEGQPPRKRSAVHPTVVNALRSSICLPVSGNVYPLGHYSVTVMIGNPPKPFKLDIDTGSELTWVQCDAPCDGCTLPLDRLYKPKNKFLPCKDPVCTAVHSPGAHQCTNPDGKCEFQIEYADHGSVGGVIVSDYFPSCLLNRSRVSPLLAFGCGCKLHNPPATSGVLGLGRSKASISSQLSGMAVIQNVVGHCLSQQDAQTGGFLVLGADFIPKSRMTWMPMSQNSFDKHYSSTPAELLSGGKPTGAKGFIVIFDTGATYTYFSSHVYQTVLRLVRKYPRGMPLQEVEDEALPICWKGPKPIKSVREVKDYFNNFELSFAGGSNIRLLLPPKAYLIVTERGHVCLGILNGSDAGLGTRNVIGDISLQDNLMIYDNENQRIGWAPANCTLKPPNCESFLL